MNFFHYLLIAFVIFGFYFNKSIQIIDKKIKIIDAASVVGTAMIIAIIVLSAYC